ncbi:MAG: excinuclease ABC subunit UvrC [Alphaproteobacteria bacterium]|nr:excinuclease ABC subunit UvrC [Alphaproteobacteria bacterium]
MEQNPSEKPLEAPAEPSLRGAARVEAYLKNLPDGPGVYRMLSAKGDVLYVGKARSLKKRVAAYAKPALLPYRIARMVSETAEMMFISTASDTEALLLEANLIKRLKPRYNVQLRDDKSFPNILLRTDHPFPQVLKHRGARSSDGIYFGPFASAGAVNTTLNTLQRAFLLRSCSDAVFHGRTRPCLLYQIKRCSAPCAGRIDGDAYSALVAQAESFLTGKSRLVQEQLAQEMQQASQAMEFERAAQLRDRIRAMSQIQARQGINPATIVEADVFALHREGAQSCVQVFFFRAGQNWGNRPFFPRHAADVESAELLSSFIGQFYDTRPAPKLILVSEEVADRELLAEALAVRTGHKIEISIPARGEKREVVAAALQNAREQLIRSLAESASQRALLEGVATAFGLEGPPKRIEVYDNSHIQGAHAVGAMIVAGPEGFQKPEYRKFNIKSEDLAPGDDLAMMREVLMRRFGRLVRDATEQSEQSDKWNKWPDLVLIDGGPAQVDAAYAALAEVGAGDVVLVGIAKSIERESGREHFCRLGQAPFRLDEKSPVLYFLQRLRDEAHRFAIGGHRKKRSKAIGASPLDEIAGVGRSRKKALLSHFGSARTVAQASLSDLQSVQGINSALARKIYEFFHPE